MTQAQTIEALHNAVEDVRLNGREGRTVQQIADLHGVKVTSLRTKLVHAGLTNLNHKTQSSVTSGPLSGQSAPAQDASNSDGLSNSLRDRGIQTNLTKLVENRGNEGVTTSPKELALSSKPNGAVSALNEADSAILEVKTEVVKEYRRLLREARRQIEIKNVKDYKAIADHLLELLGDTKDKKGGAPLIQVTILGDSGNREPKFIRSINDSGNESEAIEAESVTV